MSVLPLEHVFVIDDENNNAGLSDMYHVLPETTFEAATPGTENVPALHSPQDVMLRIEHVISSIMDSLNREESPIITPLPREEENTSNIVTPTSILNTESTTTIASKRFQNLAQCRGFTSILLVMSYVFSLLLSKRTTTTREVYYFYVTHFRSQNECDMAIRDAANMLRVPRHCLGLMASPRGWFCGSFRITHHDGNATDGDRLSSINGLPITSKWIELAQEMNSPQQQQRGRRFDVVSNAKCILVVEKEGVYNRLSEDRFFDRYPSILVTGKGFPDVATRALVFCLHNMLRIPVYGVADCDPYGVGVLQTYMMGSQRIGVDGGDRYSVPIQWLGLRPSHIETLGSKLPRQALQSQTDLDKKRLRKLCQEETSPFLSRVGNEQAELRLEELQLMQSGGYKVELEALGWLGMNYLHDWVYDAIVGHENAEDHEDEPYII